VEVVGEAADGSEALVRYDELLPDLVVMDVNMPHMNGIAATGSLLRRHPDARVLILTMHDHPEFLIEVVRSGARGCLSKAAPAEDLLRAVERVAEGGSAFEADTIVRYVRRFLPAPPCAIAEPVQKLTSRENEVLALVGEGCDNRQIAQRLRVALRTVETYRERLMRKLDLHDAGDVRACARAGMLGLHSEAQLPIGE
jgi:DNA-binding NarL/FixJ family response regulator